MKARMTPNHQVLPRIPVALACAALCLTGLLGATSASALTITIHNADGNGEGFNDPAPAPPVGGNPGTTLGQQRLFLFQYAADAWGLRLGGNLPVIVTAKFESLGGTSVSATLGFAAPVTVHRDFTNAPASLTWYVAPLANQLYGTDLNDLVPQSCPSYALPLVGGKCPDIFTQFNSDVDGPVVLGATDFYYGIDGNSGSDIDFLSVVLHEIGHGLGVLDLIDPDTGIIDPNPQSPSCNSCSDAYTANLLDGNLPVGSMTNNQRKQAVLSTGKLVFAGPNTKASTGALFSGVRDDGAVKVYAPNPYEPGSSVAHVDTSVTPNELMEPFAFNPPPRDFTVSLGLLADLGWPVMPVPKCGDPNNSKTITATDANQVLVGAVGAGFCPGRTCDVNFSNSVTTLDALLVLRRAVGLTVDLSCPLI